MKKVITKALVLAGIASALPTGWSQAYATNLQIGNRGQEVVTLQQELRTLGFFSYPTNTGYFGKITQRAVTNFQKSTHIDANGIVDSTTWRYLNEKQPSDPLTLGSKGEQVTTLQKKLRSLGYTIAPDTYGTFGNQTLRAVKSYQRSNPVVANGIVGPDTWKYLLIDTNEPTPSTKTQTTKTTSTNQTITANKNKPITVSNKKTPVVQASEEDIVPVNAKSNTKAPTPSLVTNSSIASPPAQTSSIIGSVVDASQNYLGVPYQWAGTSPSGFDCSGFVQYVYRQQGVNLPRSSTAMYNQGSRVVRLQPGDLVFFNTSGTGVSHVGIYIGNNQFISATSSYGVHIDSLSNSYWGPRYVGAKRL